MCGTLADQDYYAEHLVTTIKNKTAVVSFVFILYSLWFLALIFSHLLRDRGPSKERVAAVL